MRLELYSHCCGRSSLWRWLVASASLNAQAFLAPATTRVVSRREVTAADISQEVSSRLGCDK